MFIKLQIVLFRSLYSLFLLHECLVIQVIRDDVCFDLLTFPSFPFSFAVFFFFGAMVQDYDEIDDVNFIVKSPDVY